MSTSASRNANKRPHTHINAHALDDEVHQQENPAREAAQTAHWSPPRPKGGWAFRAGPQIGLRRNFEAFSFLSRGVVAQTGCARLCDALHPAECHTPLSSSLCALQESHLLFIAATNHIMARYACVCFPRVRNCASTNGMMK